MKCISTLLMLGVIAAAVADTADAQTSYVRYEQAGEISWGELDGSTIHQLSDAPYLGGMRTGPAEYPGLFIVPASSIIGSGENIVRPPGSQNLHYEAEMVVVIGRRAVNVSPEDAPNYIFGVSAGNDVSERAWQGGDIQWVRAKGSRTFNAVGPVLVAGLDYTNLQIEGRLNGDVRQGENSADLIFNMNHMVSYISRYFTLEPGDLIWSGTMGRTRAMEPGDVYEVEIEGIGILRNEVVQGH